MMRLRRLIRRSATGAALTLAIALVTPASAHPGGEHGVPPAPDTRPEWRGDHGPRGIGLEPSVREDWLHECRDRLSIRDRDGPPDDCEAYLEDYLDYARAYGARGYGPAGMAPAVLQPQGEPKCTETIEYEYVDVPSRPAARRAPRRAPDKRIRVIPDKRVGGE